MAVAAELEKKQPIPIDERVLTEVDHLSRNRLADGSYEPKVLGDVLVNLRTAVQEAAMPYAVSTTEHERFENPDTKKGTFIWLGKTAVEAAMSGYNFHSHQSAIKRVDIEVDEASHAETDLRPYTAKVFISPRMTRKDAPLDIAKQEHLANDDSVRVSWPEYGSNGQIEKRVLQSLLVRDIPLDAWVSLLRDKGNIFGKSIYVDDPESALSVMEIHRELEVSLDMLPDGPVTIVEAVLPYINEPEIVRKVSKQIELFHGDQADMQAKAENIAERWLAFEVALSESLDSGFASFEIRRFIIGLQEQWGADDLQIIQTHQLPDTEFRMSRQLAVVLEKAKQNTLWAPAAVITNNLDVLGQLDSTVAQRIYENEMLLQAAWVNGQTITTLESQNNKLIAAQNIRVGGGCPGESQANFKRDGEGDGNGNSLENKDDKEEWVWKKGVCQVKTCSTRPGETEVGPCSVCRKCQEKFDNGEDPTQTTDNSNTKDVSSKNKGLFEVKVGEVEQHEAKNLTVELDKLVVEEKHQLSGVY